MYDAVGNVLASVDENSNRTTYGYDVLNRQVTVEDALGNVSTTVYDAVDNVLSVTNARGYT